MEFRLVSVSSCRCSVYRHYITNIYSLKWRWDFPKQQAPVTKRNSVAISKSYKGKPRYTSFMFLQQYLKMVLSWWPDLGEKERNINVKCLSDLYIQFCKPNVVSANKMCQYSVQTEENNNQSESKWEEKKPTQNTLLITHCWYSPSVCDLLRKMVLARAWSEGLDSKARSKQTKTKKEKTKLNYTDVKNSFIIKRDESISQSRVLTFKFNINHSLKVSKVLKCQGDQVTHSVKHNVIH